MNTNKPDFEYEREEYRYFWNEAAQSYQLLDDDFLENNSYIASTGKLAIDRLDYANIIDKVEKEKNIDFMQAIDEVENTLNKLSNVLNSNPLLNLDDEYERLEYIEDNIDNISNKYNIDKNILKDLVNNIEVIDFEETIANINNKYKNGMLIFDGQDWEEVNKIQDFFEDSEIDFKDPVSNNFINWDIINNNNGNSNVAMTDILADSPDYIFVKNIDDEVYNVVDKRNRIIELEVYKNNDEEEYKKNMKEFLEIAEKELHPAQLEKLYYYLYDYEDDFNEIIREIGGLPAKLKKYSKFFRSLSNKTSFKLNMI